MKTITTIALVLAGTVLASAQGVETKGTMLMEQKTKATVDRKPAPNQAVRRKVSLDGIAVQCFQTDHPAQLINPFAPPEYGKGEQNVARDPMDGKVRGLKLFNVAF
jgi:hypothetical protein